MIYYLYYIIYISLQVHYPNAFVLMEHLTHMGEGTAANNRHYAVGRDSFLAMAAVYQSVYCTLAVSY
jgi:hypothetical protein